MRKSIGLESQTDEALILSYASGNTEAFDQLFSRYGRKVYNLFLRAVNNKELAGDLTQETWVRVIEARHRFKPTRSFSSWLYTIAMNLLRDELRRRKRQSENERSAINGDQLAAVASSLPEEENELSNLKAHVQAAIQSLPEEQREVILLAKYQGLSYAEAAEALGISEAAAKQRAYRALKSLKGKMEKLADNSS